MPGLYLAFLLLSLAGIATLDARWGLVLFGRGAARGGRRRASVAIAIGLAFFVVWDAAGIITGIFIRGDSPLLIGLDLAPHLPVEEPVFLVFLCYLALLCYAAALRLLEARARAREAM